MISQHTPYQPSFENFEVRQDASLDDFDSQAYLTIVNAVKGLCQDKLTELFVVGGRGVGKTHLALAIFDAYTKQNNNALYLSLSDVVGMGDTGALMGLETFDLIILDDVQAISQKDEWQEALFHLINRIREQQKQLVFLADNTPRELDITLLDLITRLSLSPVLHLPDGQGLMERHAIVHSILRRKNWRLPDEILNHLIQEGPQNAKDIITVLESITPLLTHLSRVQVPKKLIEEAKQIINTQTLHLEIRHYDEFAQDHSL